MLAAAHAQAGRRLALMEQHAGQEVAEHDIQTAGYTSAAPGWAGHHTEYISHDVEITGQQIAVGGPWLDVALPPGTEVTLTLRLRLRVRVPSAQAPWDAAPGDAAGKG